MRLQRINKSLLRVTLYLSILCVVIGCNSNKSSSDKEIVYVTIAPLKMLVENIVGDDFEVRVLVPAGASPESFEPTPRQYISLNESKFVFGTGLIEFEKQLISHLDKQSSLVDLSAGIELISGCCSHESEDHKHEHKHGVDPHIWTSPVELQIIARNVYDNISASYPDSIKYHVNYTKLQDELELLDNMIEASILRSEVKMFIVYHPTLTYYARAYNLEQIAIEDNGNEPSAKHMSSVIKRASANGVKTVLFQHQYPRAIVETIANDIHGRCVEIDPLSEDIIDQIKSVTDIITTK